MAKLTIDDLDLRGKRVLVRVDFNVPLDENQNITDDTRILGALPTLQKIVESGGRAVLMSHLGRPKGGPDDKEKFSLAPVAARLGELLGKTVKMAPDCIGEETENLVNSLIDGETIMLENVRFHKEETKNDPDFAAALAKLGDVYVNDAFGSAHRAHASTEGVARHFEGKAACGYLMRKELECIGKARENPARPFVAILGGAKVSDKIEVIKNLLNKVDTLLIGGGMAYTFYKAQGGKIGTSIVENDKVDLAREILAEAKNKGVEILLPLDNVISPEFSEDKEIRIVPAGEIPDGWMGLDVGPETAELFAQKVREAKTVVWNGPLGVFEMKSFSKGTFAIAEAAAQTDGITIVGGGDSVSAIHQSGVSDKISHISTGGGASLELLEGKMLPGVAALTEKT